MPPDRDPPTDLLNPQDYRESHQPEKGYRLVSADVTIQLLLDPRRARYTYRLRLQTLGDEPAEMWRHEVPARGGMVTNISARDEEGGLEFREPPDGGKSKIVEVRFRREVRRGETYGFTYSYEAQISSVVAPGVLHQTVTCGDWLVPNLDCGEFRVKVVFPEKATRLAAVPSPSEEDVGSVRYEQSPLRALETIGYLVAYRQRKLGAVTLSWLSSAIGTGLIGALIADALHLL